MHNGSLWCTQGCFLGQVTFRGPFQPQPFRESVSFPNGRGQPVSIQQKLLRFPYRVTAASWLLAMVCLCCSMFRKVLVVMSQDKQEPRTYSS